METKTLKPKTLDAIDDYLSLDLPQKIPCPYFNNKKQNKGVGLGVQIGKGSPKEIIEEIKINAFLSGLDLNSLNPLKLKNFIIEKNIGIDCSGLVYHILNIENRERGFNNLSSRLKFSGNFIRKIIRKYRPAQNTDVITFDNNSKSVTLKEIEPGDFIISLNQKGTEKNHIILITETKKENKILKEIKYVHSIAWQKDGLNEHGVRTGIIKILNPDLNILNQKWIEKEKINQENETFQKLNSAEKIKVKRLNWF